MKILVIQQKMIGDVLTSSILFEILRREYPDAELHYLIYRHTLPVVENNPYIDRFILFDKSTHQPINFYPFLKKIKREGYGIVIDVYSKISTALISAFSGAGITVSYQKWYTRKFYSHVSLRRSEVETPAGLAIENRLKLLAPAVAKIPADIKPRIWLTESEVSHTKHKLEKAGIPPEKLLLMISVLGSSESKTYPHKYLAELLNEIVETTGAELLFNYIPEQLPQARSIYNLCSPATQKQIHLDTFGKSLREFIALTSSCDALIGNEGGAVNMAKALDVPTFAIFSPPVSKDDWSLYENGSTNISVHLKDYRPDLFKGKSKRTIRKESDFLYNEFKPGMIKDKLQKFLSVVQTKKKYKDSR